MKKKLSKQKKDFNFQASRNRLTETTHNLTWRVKASLKQESKIRNKIYFLTTFKHLELKEPKFENKQSK